MSDQPDAKSDKLKTLIRDRQTSLPLARFEPSLQTSERHYRGFTITL